ncbi:MAG TPA: T9SS type A sorting domain-containing protein [Chitinophagales bacterium]|nr:T9SS type A sorting domain-containing protein [Chitinophagales bacterium]
MKRFSLLLTLVAFICFTALAQQPNFHPRSADATRLITKMMKPNSRIQNMRDDTAVWQNFLPCDTFVNLYGFTDSTNHDFGWLSGHNYFIDSAKAEQFVGITGDKIAGVLLWFGTATYTSSTQNIHVKIWDDDGAGGTPGTELATKDVSQQSIAADVAAGNLTLVWFTTPINLPSGGNFYAGWKQDYKKQQGHLTYDSTRAVGLLTSLITLDGYYLTDCADDSTENTAWELWSKTAGGDGHWHSYWYSYGIAIRNQIYPIVTTTACTATISPTSATICKSKSVTLTASTSSGGGTWTWAPATGLDVTTGATVVAKPTATTTYTATNSGNCSATVTVTVNPQPKANFTQGTCSGGAVLLTRTGTPTTGVTFKWFKNGTAISGATKKTYSATVTGDYKVRVTISATGCTKTSAVQTVTVNCKMAEAGTVTFNADAYPNPFSKSVSVNIASVSTEPATIQLMDFSGRTLNTYTKVDATVPFEINENLSSGVYFIKVDQGVNEKVIKVVKNE